MILHPRNKFGPVFSAKTLINASSQPAPDLLLLCERSHVSLETSSPHAFSTYAKKTEPITRLSWRLCA